MENKDNFKENYKDIIEVDECFDGDNSYLLDEIVKINDEIINGKDEIIKFSNTHYLTTLLKEEESRYKRWKLKRNDVYKTNNKVMVNFCGVDGFIDRDELIKLEEN